MSKLILLLKKKIKGIEISEVGDRGNNLIL